MLYDFQFHTLHCSFPQQKRRPILQSIQFIFQGRIPKLWPTLQTCIAPVISFQQYPFSRLCRCPCTQCPNRVEPISRIVHALILSVLSAFGKYAISNTTANSLENWIHFKKGDKRFIYALLRLPLFFPALFAHVYREAEVHYQETR